MEWREEEGKKEHIKKKGMKIDKSTEDNMEDRRNK